MEAEQQSANFIKESEEIRRLEKSIRLKHKHPTKVGSDNSARSPLVIKHLNETIDLKKKKNNNLDCQAESGSDSQNIRQGKVNGGIVSNTQF